MTRAILLFNILAVFFQLLAIQPAVAGKDVTVYAALDRLSFPIDRGAMLMVTVEGASRNVDVTLPETPDLSIDSRGQSSRINMVNGSVTSSVVYNYLVRAEKPGSYTIAPITISVGGDEYTTSPVHFTVIRSELMNDSGTAAKEDIAFLKVAVPAEHFLGEIVPLTIKAYFTDRYQANINSLPALSGDGVVMEPVSKNPVQSRERVGGKTYNVLSWETTVSGVKTGSHSLRFGLDATILIPEKNRSGFDRNSFFDDPFFRNSPFNDSLFGSMFGNVQRREVHIQSDLVSLKVLPLPQDNQPDNFNGAVGSFSLNVEANNTTVNEGEPITLSISISGEGNFDAITPPALQSDSDWKTYKPIDTGQDNSGPLSGSRTFEQAIVPQNSEIDEIPPFSFSFFDPGLKQYKTLTSSPIPVTINPVKEAAAAPTLPQQADKTPDQNEASKTLTVQHEARMSLPDLAPIKLATGKFRDRIQPVFIRPLYIGSWILLLTLFAGAIFYRLWSRRASNSPEQQRKTQLRKQLEDSLARMETACNDGNTVVFLIEARDAIQQQLSAPLGLSPSAITLADVQKHAGKNSPLAEIFSLADAAQYGALPTPVPARQLQQYLLTMQKELKSLC